MTTKKLEDWATAKATPSHVIAGAKTLNGWGQGHELTEADFDAGIKAWGEVRLGGEPAAAPAPAPEEARVAVFNDYASPHTKKKGS